MRTLLAACCLHSVVFISILFLAMLLTTPSGAVMPPSTSLQPAVDETTSATPYVSGDSTLGQQILAQVQANHQLLEKIEREENVIAAHLQNSSTRATLEVTRS